MTKDEIVRAVQSERRRTLHLLGTLDADAFDTPTALLGWRVRQVVGRAPLGMLLWSRAYDEWVHRQDIRRALGLPDDDVDLVPAAQYVLSAIGIDTLPRLDASSGPVDVSLEGVPLLPWRFEPRAGSSGPDRVGAHPPARISAPAPAFVMAAAGRGSFSSRSDPRAVAGRAAPGPPGGSAGPAPRRGRRASAP